MKMLRSFIVSVIDQIAACSWFVVFVAGVCIIGPFLLIYTYMCQGCLCQYCRRMQFQGYLNRQKTDKSIMPTSPRRAWVVVQTPDEKYFVGLNDEVKQPETST